MEHTGTNIACTEHVAQEKTEVAKHLKPHPKKQLESQVSWQNKMPLQKTVQMPELFFMPSWMARRSQRRQEVIEVVTKPVQQS